MARLKRNTRKMAFVVILLVLVLSGAFIAFYMISTKQIKELYEEELNSAKATISSNMKQVYVAAKDISYGEVITEEHLKATTILAALDSSAFFSPEDVGSVALVSIPVDSVIMANMVIKESYDDTLREIQYDVVVLNSNLANGNFVDVRIRYQNGEDYIVLSHKKVKNISLNNAICYMDLTEEEMQLMASAIVDACIYNAVLYTTTYIDASIQAPSIVTYQPSADVLRTITNNPNIIDLAKKDLSAEVRREMEYRLSLYESVQIGNGTFGGNVFNTQNTPTIENVGNLQNEYFGGEWEEVN